MSSKPHMLQRSFFLLISVIVSTSLLAAVRQSTSAQEVRPRPPDLSTSEKTVNADEAQPDSILQYTIDIRNDGTDPAPSVTMTDPLPVGLELLTETISLTGGGIYTASSNVITWAGAVNNNSAVQIRFDAQVSETLNSGTWLTNTTYITGTGDLITRVAGTQIVTSTDTVSYMPFFARVLPPPPTPSLAEISGPDANNQWTVNWSVSSDEFVDGYTLEESHDLDFDAPNTINTPLTSHDFSHPASYQNTYYYRVRAHGPGGISDWSEVREITGNYRDDFKSDITGWRIVREDLDDTDNSSRYQANHFVMEIDGRWDYAIASNLAKAPDAPYAIETSVRLESADNLNSYGIIWGADWNGENCLPDRDHTNNCFNHYYRLNILWFGNPSIMHYQLTRIHSHDPGDNTGNGPNLIPFREVNVNNPSSGYQVWRVEYYPNGDIKLFVNGNQFAEVNDSTYVNDPYFGVFASSNEYLGTEPWFDWYTVTAID